MESPKINLSNITVDEFTSVDPICISSTTLLIEVKTIIEQYQIRHIPILEEKSPIGVISSWQLNVLDNKILGTLKAKDIMTPEPFTAFKNDLLKDVVFEMSQRKIGSALIKDSSEHLYGIFTSIDALNAIIEAT